MSESGPNWLGLLKWSLQYSDGTSGSSCNAMSDDDKEWLKRAMSDLVKDEPNRMNEVLNELKQFIEGINATGNVNDEQIGQIETLLEELQDIVEQIDMAQICVKFGGLTCLLLLLESVLVGDRVRSVCATTIATLSQNNIKVQNEMYTRGVIDKLCNLLPSTSSVVASKILLAISCIIRNHEAAEVHFTRNYSTAIFTHSLRSGHNAFMRRAIFLASALLTSDSSNKLLCESSFPAVFIPCVFQFLSSDDLDLRDVTLRMLKIFASASQGHAALNAHIDALNSAIAKRSESDNAFPAEENVVINEIQNLLREPASVFVRPVQQQLLL